MPGTFMNAAEEYGFQGKVVGPNEINVEEMIADIETATIRRDSVTFEFRRPLTRGDIKRLAESSVPIEFHTPSHGRHRVHCRRVPDAGPIPTALSILRGFLASEVSFKSPE